MSRHLPTIESIKENISYLKELIGDNTIIMPQTTIVDNKSYAIEIEKTPYHEFIVFADYHYFISRVLFMNSLDLYSFFAGQQCIENYLKAFVRFKKKIPEKTHCLTDLLKTCKEHAKKEDEFLFSDEILTIIFKYEPFNEISRYPVSKTKINGYMSSYPEDIYLLDYFVYKFREIIPFPERYRDLLKGDHFYVNSCKEHSPLMYEYFTNGNINYK